MKEKQPYGALELLRTYTCGCSEYVDQKGSSWAIDSVFCKASNPANVASLADPHQPEHRAQIAIGQASQKELF